VSSFRRYNWHDTGLTQNLDIVLFQIRHQRMNVWDGQRYVSKCGTVLVGLISPVLRQFNGWTGVATVSVSHKGNRKLCVQIGLSPHFGHAKHISLKRDGSLEFIDPKHGVQNACRCEGSWTLMMLLVGYDIWLTSEFYALFLFTPIHSKPTT
jgi:hypothetical protein